MHKKTVENLKKRKKPKSKKRVHIHRYMPSAILNTGKTGKRDILTSIEMSGLLSLLTLYNDHFRSG